MRTHVCARGAMLAAALPVAAMLIAGAEPTHAAVISHWSFDSGSLTTDGTNITAVADQTGSHNATPGTGGTGGTGSQFVSAAFPVASSSVTGQFGQSLRFAGNNFLLFNNLTELMQSSGAPSYTVSMWAKTESAGGSVGASRFTALSNWGNQPAAAGPTRFTYAWGINSATQPGAQSRSGGSTNGTDIYSRTPTIPNSGTINDGSFHMLTWTFNSTTGNLITYFDGNQIESFTSAAVSFQMGNSSSTVGDIGLKADTGTFLPAGVILDEMWVLNEVLPATGVQTLFTTNTVPEPASAGLLALGAGLAIRRRRRA